MQQSHVNILIKKLPATITGRRKVGKSFVVDKDGFENAFNGLTASQVALNSTKSKAGVRAAKKRKENQARAAAKKPAKTASSK